MPIVNRLDFLLHYPSAVLCGKYLNEVPVLVMCPLQPIRSDMQNGTDLLRRQKKRQSKCQTVFLWTGTGGAGVGACWCRGEFMLNVCVCVSVLWQGLMCASRCVQTNTLAYLCVCACVFVYAIISFIRHYFVSTISPCQPNNPPKNTHNTHTQVSWGLILNAWKKRGVWCYCGALSRLMTPGTRSPTDG